MCYVALLAQVMWLESGPGCLLHLSLLLHLFIYFFLTAYSVDRNYTGRERTKVENRL